MDKSNKDETPGAPPSLLRQPLSPRMLEILGMLAGGMTQRQVAQELGISISTVKVRLAQSCVRLGVATRQEAIIVAATTGLIERRQYERP